MKLFAVMYSGCTDQLQHLSMALRNVFFMLQFFLSIFSRLHLWSMHCFSYFCQLFAAQRTVRRASFFAVYPSVLC